MKIAMTPTLNFNTTLMTSAMTIEQSVGWLPLEWWRVETGWLHHRSVSSVQGRK